jgi:hypothetical protein
VSVGREEPLFEREVVLGRDTTSVFPREALAAAAKEKEALKEALGAKMFVSETEVQPSCQSASRVLVSLSTFAPRHCHAWEHLSRLSLALGFALGPD